MELPITYYPAKSLNEPSVKVEDFEAAGKLVPDMIDTMNANKGIGLAAPQVGNNIRLAVIHKDASKELNEHLVIINPKIFSASSDREEDIEGCLSMPGIEGIVARCRKIKLRFADTEGVEHKCKATGLLARVIQHEIDHLDGILFTERTDNITKGEKGLKKLPDGTLSGRGAY